MTHTIIVTIHTKPQLTLRCLESIARTTDLKANTLIIIDDHSANPTKSVVNRFCDKRGEAILIRNTRMLGKPKSVNRAIHAHRTSDYFTIIDNDVVIHDKRWVSKLIKTHHDWKDKAILGAYTYMSGYPFTKNSVRYLDPWPYWNLAGCFFSFSKTIFKKLGYFFDKTTRSEDADYCRRAYLAGFTWYYIKDIRASISGHKPVQERDRQRRLDLMGQHVRRRWADHVMKTHRVYYKPKSFDGR